jgi:multiple sugar transport system substrate-binding protein
VDVVNKFNEENPWKITIEMDIVASTQLNQKLNTAFPAGEAAELMLMNMNNRFRYKDYTIPHTDVWEITKLKKEDFLPGHLLANTVDGDLLFLPFQYSAQYTYWNKDLFRKAGLDPEKPPMSFAEWTTMAEKITDPSANVFGTGVYYNSNQQTSEVLAAAGGNAIIETSPGKYKVVFAGNQGFKDTLMWVNDLYSRGLNPTEENVQPMFLAGQIGIMLDGSWLKAGSDAAGIDYGVAKTFGKDPTATIGGFMITTSCKTEIQRQACYKFIEYWYLGLDGSDLRNTGAGRWAFDIGFPASYIPLMNLPEYKENKVLQDLTPSNPEAFSPRLVPLSFVTNLETVVQALIQSVVFTESKGAALEAEIDAALALAQQDAEALVVQFHGEDSLVK